MVHAQEKEQSIETILKEAHELHLLGKDNFNYGQRTYGLLECLRMMSHQVQNINKEKEIIQNDQIEILELKSTITKMKICWRNSIADLSRQKKESAQFNID